MIDEVDEVIIPLIEIEWMLQEQKLVQTEERAEVLDEQKVIDENVIDILLREVDFLVIDKNDLCFLEDTHF